MSIDSAASGETSWFTRESASSPWKSASLCAQLAPDLHVEHVFQCFCIASFARRTAFSAEDFPLPSFCRPRFLLLAPHVSLQNRSRTSVGGNSRKHSSQ